MSDDDKPLVKPVKQVKRRVRGSTSIRVGHYPQEQFPCATPDCGRSYLRLCDLQKHVRTHTVHQPYICNQCNKVFSRPDDLAKHRRIDDCDVTSDNSKKYSTCYSEVDLENGEDQFQATGHVSETSGHGSHRPQSAPQIERLQLTHSSSTHTDDGLSWKPVEGDAEGYMRELKTTMRLKYLSRALTSLTSDALTSPEPKSVRAHCAPVREPSAWRLNYKIGTGACGTVFLENVHLPGMESPELWAVKKIPRASSNFTLKRYQAEVKNLQALRSHEWFVKFNSAYEDTHYMYIAMEYISMGDMSQSFKTGYQWSESDTRVVIKQLLHGLSIMHKEGITHRDMKPENIFLYLPENQSRVLRVKIGDFGTSKRVPPSNASTYLKTTTGTQSYMAPEVHDTSQPKTNKVDIWSLGCILYRMFAGNLLFKDSVEVLRYSWTAPTSPLALDDIGFSIPCAAFLRDILQPIPEDRPSAEDCLTKSWIMTEVPGPEYSIGKDLYTKLSKISDRAPNVHSFPDIVANQAVESTSIP